MANVTGPAPLIVGVAGMALVLWVAGVIFGSFSADTHVSTPHQPRATRPTRPKGGGGSHSHKDEARECSVRRVECAQYCELLVDSSIDSCVRESCKNIDENCLEKLIHEIRERKAAQDFNH